MTATKCHQLSAPINKHCTKELTHDAIASNRTVAAYRRQIERLGREINSILAQESHHLSKILSLVNRRI